MDVIGGLVKLQFLDVSASLPRKKLLSKWANLTELTSLNLAHCDLVDSDLKSIKKFTKLRNLSLSANSKITRLSFLSKLSALEKLNISSCPLVLASFSQNHSIFSHFL